MLFAAAIMMAMCFTCCDKDPNNGGGNNYPSTANVIRNAVEDIDGNKYDAVKIGDQVWMAQNLRTTRYADGTEIPLGDTYSTKSPYRYIPGLSQTSEENMTNVEEYGYLYNGPAVIRGTEGSEANPSGIQGICPNGWHVPSSAEWVQLKDYMESQSIYLAGGYSTAGFIAKALAAQWGWIALDNYDEDILIGCNLWTNNASGFSALPAGNYSKNGVENFGYATFFMSSTKNCNFENPDGIELYPDTCIFIEYYLSRLSSTIDYYPTHLDPGGSSVRCVRD